MQNVIKVYFITGTCDPHLSKYLSIKPHARWFIDARVIACKQGLGSSLTIYVTIFKQTLPDEAPPVGKIYLFSKIAVTFEPIQRF